MQLTGQRILLREFSDTDVVALTAIHADPRALRYYAPEVGTLEHTQMLVELFVQWANENPRDNFQLAIVDRETDALVGSCGVRRKGCSAGRAEFGIGIGSVWWGKGSRTKPRESSWGLGSPSSISTRSMAWQCPPTWRSRSSCNGSVSLRVSLDQATPG